MLKGWAAGGGDRFGVESGVGSARPGDQAVLFGPGLHAEPLAQDWADALGTIHYEIVTRIGTRVPRRYIGAQSDVGDGP